MTCTWYAADHDTATGPADYQSFGSFADALASTTSFTAPVLVWGSLAAYLAHDGSADFVDMIFTPGFINHGWNWVIGPTSQHIGHSGAGGLLTAQAALEGVLASPYTRRLLP
jgi:hypothetical protein